MLPAVVSAAPPRLPVRSRAVPSILMPSRDPSSNGPVLLSYQTLGRRERSGPGSGGFVVILRSERLAVLPAEAHRLLVALGAGERSGDPVVPRRVGCRLVVIQSLPDGSHLRFERGQAFLDGLVGHWGTFASPIPCVPILP